MKFKIPINQPEKFKTGWLAPNGKIYECDYFEHLKNIPEELAKDYPQLLEWRQIAKDNQEAYLEDFRENGLEEDGCGWHRYDDNLEYRKVLDEIYTEGFIRYGNYYEYVEFEGVEKFIKSKMGKIKLIADECGKRAKFNYIDKRKSYGYNSYW